MSSLCSVAVLATTDRPPVITPEMIRRLTPLLMHTAIRLLHQRQAAEDAVQETWIGAINSYGDYEGRSSLTTWLIAILRRKACDLRRRGRATQSIEEDDWVIRPRFEDQVDARDQLQVANAVAAALPPREHQALLLCDVRGLDRDEAAERMTVSRGHLRVILHRGRCRIREAIAGP